MKFRNNLIKKFLRFTNSKSLNKWQEEKQKQVGRLGEPQQMSFSLEGSEKL